MSIVAAVSLGEDGHPVHVKPSSGGNSRVAIEKKEADCPLAFYSSGSYWVSSPSNDREAIQKSGKACPPGWYSSGGYSIKSR